MQIEEYRLQSNSKISIEIDVLIFKFLSAMKKFFALIVSLICMSVIAYADNYDTCKVTGGNGATVAVSIIDFDADGNVSVEISSDCDDYVNVSFTLTLTSEYGTNGSNSFTVSAQPNSNTVKKYKVRKKVAHDITEVSVVVSGARCAE